MTAPHPLMTGPEVAAVWQVHDQTVGRWRRAGKITGIPTPGERTYRYLRAEVEALLAGQPLTAEQVAGLRERLMDGAP
jgi:predicted site-specific integrase-resolvase